MNYYVQDTRGYLDGSSSCSKCDACECLSCNEVRELWEPDVEYECDLDTCFAAACHNEQVECIGLSYVYCNLDDGADNLCEDCYQEGEVKG